MSNDCCPCTFIWHTMYTFLCHFAATGPRGSTRVHHCQSDSACRDNLQIAGIENTLTGIRCQPRFAQKYTAEAILSLVVWRSMPHRLDDTLRSRWGREVEDQQHAGAPVLAGPVPDVVALAMQVVEGTLPTAVLLLAIAVGIDGIPAYADPVAGGETERIAPFGPSRGSVCVGVIGGSVV